MSGVVKRDAAKLKTDLTIVGRAAVKKAFMGLVKSDDKVDVARAVDQNVLMIN